MDLDAKRYKCEPLTGVYYPAGVRPPDLYAYPRPPRAVHLVFIGWNPPKSFGGFWSLDTEDNLRSDIHEILIQLKQIEAQLPDGIFLEEFLSKGFFFIHAVKCWTHTKYPGFGRNARRLDRKRIGVPLLQACAGTHLGAELHELSPGKVCALGEVPYLALCHVFRESRLPSDAASPTEGRIFEPEPSKLNWPLLYTCFPQSQRVRVRGKDEKVPAKELVRKHLERFL